MEVEKVNVLGVGISVLDQDRAREFLFDALRRNQRGYVSVTGVLVYVLLYQPTWLI